MVTCIERNILEIAGLTPPPSTLNILTEESPVWCYNVPDIRSMELTSERQHLVGDTCTGRYVRGKFQ